ALINVFLFKGNYGDISNALVFENTALLKSGARYFLLNLAALAAAGILTAAFLYSRLSRFVPSFAAILLISFTTGTGISAFSIQKEYAALKNRTGLSISIGGKAYRVSRTGKNIFVFMLDRAMNFFIDPIFENSEKVRETYTGFTLYRNALSFGLATNISTPSLFGGYEYTPENINKRSTELLVDKHNEALSVLPRLFSEHDWNVSFTDPSWLNYSWQPDLTPLRKYDMIAQNTEYKYGKDPYETTDTQNAGGGGGGGIQKGSAGIYYIFPFLEFYLPKYGAYFI
ncbi:MAG: hypothetical protein ACTTKL_10940, partial [Treponema sp.]